MSSSGFDLGDQSRRTAEAQSDMYDALEDLGNTIDRGHDLLEEVTDRHRKSEDALERLLEEVEQDYQTVSDFAERNTERQREMNESIRDLGRSDPQQYRWDIGFGQTQWFGGMYQQQRMGWNSFWNNPYQQQQQWYGGQQQRSQGQNWQEEFFGNSDEDDILNEDDNSNEEGSVDIGEMADESESDNYDNTDDYDPDGGPDGSVDMGDSWNPDASFDYEAEQSTETVNQSFSFSGSGFEPSGSITMEQSAGGETQYFEASF